MDSILVVGGRTTGLMMASELARRGVPVRCIDLSPGIDPHVRANLLHPRTLEIFQGLGLDEDVTLGSVPEKAVAFYHAGAHLGDAEHAAVPSPFPYALSQSQAHNEAVLEAHLNRVGVTVERGVSLTSMAQDAGGVDVTLHHADGTAETARFQWVVGCDGAHSVLRKSLGLAFPGEVDAIPYVLGDVLIADNDSYAPEKAHVFFHEDGDLYLFTRLPKNRQFVVATVKPGAIAGDAPTLAELQQIVSTRAGPGLHLSDPQWLGAFRINYRLVPQYRQGRVFLAGDAAHVHSLMAGHGMNTGIQDAHNLAWKLSLVVRGLADATMLETYEVERRPVADDVVKSTRQITDTMESFMDLSEPERAAFLAEFSTTTVTPIDAERQAQEIDLDYGSSALSLADAETWPGGPGPGTRAPDASELVFEGAPTNLFRIPADPDFRLFFFCGEGVASSDEINAALAASARFTAVSKPYVICDPAQAAQFGDHAVIVDPQGAMHAAYGAQRPSVYVVRPDGYVAYRSSDLASLGRYFAHVGIAAV